MAFNKESDMADNDKHEEEARKEREQEQHRRDEERRRKDLQEAVREQEKTRQEPNQPGQHMPQRDGRQYGGTQGQPGPKGQPGATAMEGAEQQPVVPREPTKPFADEGEASVTGINMGVHNAAAVPKLQGDPVDYEEVAEDAAEYIVSDVPVMMSDPDVTILGRQIESRYIPPPTPPTVIEQLNMMNEAPSIPIEGENPEGMSGNRRTEARAGRGQYPPIRPQRKDRDFRHADQQDHEQARTPQHDPQRQRAFGQQDQHHQGQRQDQPNAGRTGPPGSQHDQQRQGQHQGGEHKPGEHKPGEHQPQHPAPQPERHSDPQHR